MAFQQTMYGRGRADPMQNVMKPGMIVEGFRLVHVLGRGGFGEVWEAEEKTTTTPVAIKFLQANLMSQDSGNHLDLQARFREEARILTELNHPGLVKMLGVIDRYQPRVLGYVMERLYGQSLEDLRCQIEFGALVHAFRRVAEALFYLHTRNIIHRDVKAGNVFVCDLEASGPGRSIKLLDFGIAKIPDGDIQTKSGVFLGTLNTMAPECFDGLVGPASSVTPAADQWSFGVMMIRMLTGRMPFPGKNPAELVHRIRSKPPKEPPLLEEFEHEFNAQRLLQIARRCLEKSPKARYASMQDLAHLLYEVEQDITQLRMQGGQPVPSFAFEQLLSAAGSGRLSNSFSADHDTFDDNPVVAQPADFPSSDEPFEDPDSPTDFMPTSPDSPTDTFSTLPSSDALTPTHLTSNSATALPLPSAARPTVPERMRPPPAARPTEPATIPPPQAASATEPEAAPILDGPTRMVPPPEFASRTRSPPQPSRTTYVLLAFMGLSTLALVAIVIAQLLI